MSDHPLSTAHITGQKIYFCTDFEGHYPVGSAAIVVASNPDEARDRLEQALRERGLSGNGPLGAGSAFKLEQLDTEQPGAHILVDGNY